MPDVHGFDGAVVSPHGLATEAGLDALNRGGSAVDAVIAVNAVQGVVAPETCGIGGDLFALVHDKGTVTALNASGRAGSNASADLLRAEGHTAMPPRHPASITIPGCVAGWFALHDRHGRLPMEQNLRRAIELARDGFPASTEYARASLRLAGFLEGHEGGAQILQGGRPPHRTERVTRPNLAATLERIAVEGPSAFYDGPVARSVSEATSGRITLDDLLGYLPDWVDPISTDVFGLTGWTIPPNSQGYQTLATLAIFADATPTWDPGDPRWTHTLVEAYRAVAGERDDVVADPSHAPLPDRALLDRARLTVLAEGIHQDHVTRRSRPRPKPGGTMYCCAVDGSGMGVSFIESNFHGIGSGIGAGDSGFILHNRGAGFDLRPGHPNELGPGKRPLHTLSPTLWTEADTLRAMLGTRGGDQQPQLVAQVAALVFGAGRTPGHAQDTPRWTISDLSSVATQSVLDVESDMNSHVVDGLARRGHEIVVRPHRVAGWGPVSMISIDPSGLRTAAADPRVDTATAGAR